MNKGGPCRHWGIRAGKEGMECRGHAAGRRPGGAVSRGSIKRTVSFDNPRVGRARLAGVRTRHVRRRPSPTSYIGGARRGEAGPGCRLHVAKNKASGPGKRRGLRARGTRWGIARDGPFPAVPSNGPYHLTTRGKEGRAARACAPAAC